MRDRLIAVLGNFPTHFETKLKDRWFPEAVERLADHLLAEGVIVLPCKVGDTVYYLTTIDTEKELGVRDIYEGAVCGIGFNGENTWIEVKYTNGLYYYHIASDFGKTVFLTKEQAQKALEERSKQ